MSGAATEAGRGSSKVALVTGSSTGIGRACALHLDRLGFRVLAGVRKPDDGEALRAAASERLEPLILDVTDERSVEAARRRLEEDGGRLDGLVNNAGIAVPGPVEGVPLEEWRRQLEVNVVGQVSVTRTLLAMLRASRGRVVLMSSIGGRSAVPMLSPYNASKFALSAIGDSLRQEMRPFGVEVSIIEPGAIATPIWEKGRASASAARAAMGEDIERVYGEGLDRMERFAVKAADQGIPAEKVAEAVADALTAKRPKTRYLVGRDAKARALLKRLLPDRATDWIIEQALRR